MDRLPTELINIVISYLIECEEIYSALKYSFAHRSVLALGLSSPLLYARFLERIHRDYQCIALPSWAGQQLGFHGGRSAFTRDQLEQYDLRDWNETNKYEKIGDVDWVNVGNEPEWIWYRILDFVEMYEGGKDGLWGVNPRGWRLIRGDIGQEWKYKSRKPWVLRNLETREFVREDHLTALEPAMELGGMILSPQLRMRRKWTTLKRFVTSCGAHSKHDDKDGLTLAQIFLVMTAYSRPGTVTEHEVPLLFHDGPWSTHAFDLVPLGEHKIDHANYEASEERSKPWTDVTEIVALDVQNLRDCVRHLTSVYGYLPDWASANTICESVIASRERHRAWHDARECKIGHGELMSVERQAGFSP